MTPWEMFGITFTPDGLASALGAGIGAGVVVGTFFVLVTLFYGRSTPR